MRRRDFITLISGGAIAACPLAARAQQKAMPVIGWLRSTTAASSAPLVAAFQKGLSETGYIDGKNVAVEYRWADGHYDRLPALASELVGRRVNVIVASTPPAAFAAKRATQTIPIVFSVGLDPVAAGLVASLARPDGNLTGVSLLITDLTPKRIEILSELVPQARVFALLVNPDEPNAQRMAQAAREAALARNIELQHLNASSEREIEAAFADLAKLHPDGLVVSDDPFWTQRLEQLLALAARQAVPAIYFSRGFSDSGGLLSYGPSFVAAYQQIGIYAGRILKGARPADLPVEQPTKFELVINLKTAKALGLTVPQSLLARADEVIE